MQTASLFISSFVRTNLIYDAIPKSAENFRRILNVIQQRYKNSSGIVYCLSRKDCETVAQTLKGLGFKAEPYHAELQHSRRDKIQNLWMQGKVHVICATIAFGMGIDKPDVRFVIHHSMSSSIEAYYQETGRAGRDGLPSHCILLYSFSDHARLLKMIMTEEKANQRLQEIRKKNLYQMVAYGENVTTCRRKLLVEHFGEIYDSEICQKSIAPCSICERIKQSGSSYKLYDFTDEAVLVLQSIQLLNGTSLNNVADIYRGAAKNSKKSAAKKKKEASLPICGRGEGLGEEDVLRFMRKLIIDGFIVERLEWNEFAKTDLCYVFVSPAGERLIRTKQPKIYSYVSTEKKGKRKVASNLLTMSTVTEMMALKEKYKLKHIDIFKDAKAVIWRLCDEISREEGLGNAYNVISMEGMDQLAAFLPRTNSEILQIDSMTTLKLDRYGARIVDRLRPFWERADQREHEIIQKDFGRLE